MVKTWIDALVADNIIFDPIVTSMEENNYSDLSDLDVAKYLSTRYAQNILMINAANYGFIEVVNFFLENGVDINAHYDSELLVNTGNGLETMVKFLLENGANAYSVLTLSCNNGHIDVVKLLLDHGAYIDADEGSPLFYSAQKDHEEIVRLLIIRGADIHANDDAALLIAAEWGHKRIVRLLLENGAAVGERKNIALEISASQGYEEVVKILLEFGADIHYGHDNALMKSISYHHSSVVKLLLENGATIHDDILIDCIFVGHHDTTKLVLEYYGPLNTNFIYDYQKHINSEYIPGKIENVVDLLLEHGLDIHTDNDYLLRYAVHDDNYPMIKFLLEHGANVHALKLDRANQSTNITELLINFGANLVLKIDT